MRRLAIGSLLFAVLAAYMLQWGAFGAAGRAMSKETVTTGLRMEAAFVVFAPALVGLVLGSIVLFAPLFGRPRNGTVFAAVGVCLCLALLFLLLTKMSGR
jgi:hypothetical protein